MSRAVKRAADIGFAAISIEGGLIAPDQLLAIASAAPDQKMAADYGCPKGTNLRDEITRYFRIAQAHWQSYAKLEKPTFQQTAEFVRSLLEQGFGFSLTGPHHHEKDDRRYTIAWEAKNGRVPIVVAPPAPIEKGKPSDDFARALPEFGDGQNGRIARRSPTVLLQDWLNASSDSCWGLVFAGDRVRLMRDNASLTRPAWIEADLGSIFRDDMFADFTALWLLIHTSRFGAEGASENDSALEQWREAGMRAGVSARDRLRENVEEALLALGQGILDVNPSIRDRLDEGTLTMPYLFEQMLRVIYRLIFLGVAEDRNLLHAPETPKVTRDLYSNNYGFSWLRDRSTRRNAHDHHHDAWEGVKVVFHALERGENLLGLPALGGLFERDLMPDVHDAQIPNRSLFAAAFKLGWLIEDSRRVRINWRDMATEELGSVYEGLLELVPLRENGGRKFTFAGGAEARGNARKVSGSYYTPDSLVQCLLSSTLDPVLERAEAEGGAEAILGLRIIDPACGSGHFLLGSARRMATRVAQLRNPDSPDYNAAMRDVVRNCIHGVDRNPMAIELAKVALWIESVEPGKPLGFLDANIQCGDSLLGVFDLKALDEGIPDDAYKPLIGDDKETAKYFFKRNKDEKRGQASFDFLGDGLLPSAKLAAEMGDLRQLPENTVAEIEEKGRRFRAWESDPKRYSTKVACDIYIAAFLLPKKGDPLMNRSAVTVPTTAHLRNRLGGGQIHASLETGAIDAAVCARAFHWPLAFPEVMIRKGGFDVVIGNPPWEVVQLSEEEYFASRMPEVANLKGAARKKAIAALEADDPYVFRQYQIDKRTFDAMNGFARACGRFNLTARGKVNTYGLFAEHFLNLTNATGMSGAIVPTGIATDATTAPFFGHLVNSQRLVGLIDFENSKPLFPGVHRSFKFALLTMGKMIDGAGFAFFLTDPSQLEDFRRRFTLSATQIAAINPNTKTAPVFRSRKDAELVAQIYARVPVLIYEDKGPAGNPWNVEFRQGLFNMTSDSNLFRTAVQLTIDGWHRDGSNWIKGAGRMVPLYEAKMFNFFDHRFGDFGSRGDDRGHRVMPETSLLDYQNPAFEPVTYYWVCETELLNRLQPITNRNWLLAFKDVTSATNERTAIFSMIPRVAVGHTAPLVFTPLAPNKIAALLANFNTLVLDMCARSKVAGLHLTYGYLKQFPILPPHAYSEIDLEFIVPRILELSYTSHSMAALAQDLGYCGQPFVWDEDRRAQLRADLDAWFALAYGLKRNELCYVLDPKDVMGADYPSETFRGLQKNEVAKYGEYRTQRLVLAAYDSLVSQGLRPRIEGYR